MELAKRKSPGDTPLQSRSFTGGIASPQPQHQ
jgi:hypothetical protein